MIGRWNALKCSCNEKCDHAELCEYMQGFYKYHCKSMFDVSKTYFPGVILGPSENSSPQLVSQAGYEPVPVTLLLSFE